MLKISFQIRGASIDDSVRGIRKLAISLSEIMIQCILTYQYTSKFISDVLKLPKNFMLYYINTNIIYYINILHNIWFFNYGNNLPKNKLEPKDVI